MDINLAMLGERGKCLFGSSKHNLRGANYPNDPKLFISCVRNSVTDDENETINVKSKARQQFNKWHAAKRLDIS